MDNSAEFYYEYDPETCELTKNSYDGRVLEVAKDYVPTMEHPDILVDLICNGLMRGSSLAEICDGTGGYPTLVLFTRFIDRHPVLKEKLNVAYKRRAEMLKDEILKLSQSYATQDSEEAKKTKLKIDSLQKILLYDNPDRFGKNAGKKAGAGSLPFIFIDAGPQGLFQDIKRLDKDLAEIPTLDIPEDEWEIKDSV